LKIFQKLKIFLILPVLQSNFSFRFCGAYWWAVLVSAVKFADLQFTNPHQGLLLQREMPSNSAIFLLHCIAVAAYLSVLLKQTFSPPPTCFFLFFFLAEVEGGMLVTYYSF
jgi:hypothetical protein